MFTSDSFQYHFLQEYQRGWDGGGGSVGGWDVQRRGVSHNSDPFGQTEKGGRGVGAKIEHFLWVS